jgi:hypothetical protein
MLGAHAGARGIGPRCRRYRQAPVFHAQLSLGQMRSGSSHWRLAALLVSRNHTTNPGIPARRDTTAGPGSCALSHNWDNQAQAAPTHAAASGGIRCFFEG